MDEDRRDGEQQEEEAAPQGDSDDDDDDEEEEDASDSDAGAAAGVSGLTTSEREILTLLAVDKVGGTAGRQRPTTGTQGQLAC